MAPKKNICIITVHVNVVLKGQTVFLNYQIRHLSVSKVLLFRVHSDQEKSGNQGIIREFTRWVFFLKKSGNCQGIWIQIMEIWNLVKFGFFYYNFHTLLFSLSLLLSKK